MSSAGRIARGGWFPSTGGIRAGIGVLLTLDNRDVARSLALDARETPLPEQRCRDKRPLLIGYQNRELLGEAGVPGRVDNDVVLPTDESSTRDLYTAASTPLRTIREVHTPRVIGVAEEPELVELLTKLEESDRDWSVALYNIEEWGAPDEIGWEAAAATLRAAAAVYRRAGAELLSRRESD